MTFRSKMNYIKPSNILITEKRGVKIADYLFHRFLEWFANDEELTKFIETGEMPDKQSFIQRVMTNEDGIISIDDYKEILDTIIKNLPKRFLKKKAKSILQLIDFHIGPRTFELAAELKKQFIVQEDEPSKEGKSE